MIDVTDTQPRFSTPFDVAGLAAHWDCSTTFVYAQIASGALPAWKLGGKLIRIRPADVVDYENQNALEPSQAADVAIAPLVPRSPTARLMRLARA